MISDYLSGDPYLSFAKSVGAIPPDGTDKSHGSVRDLYKSTVLGVQFSMGADRLANKLSIDTGNPVSVETAKGLIDMHHKHYREYWRWIRTLSDAVRAREPLILHDGWAIRTDPDYMTSYLNFPVQGTGGVILRKAVAYAQDAGLTICSTLHDSVYACCRESDAPAVQETLLSCMRKAAAEALYNRIAVRID